MATSALLCSLPGGCGSEAPKEAHPAAQFDAVRFEEGLLAIESWLDEGKPAQAERIARRLAKLDPDSIDALEAHGRCLMILAALEQREGRGDGTALNREALERYRSALGVETNIQNPALLHAAGLAAHANGELDEAIDYHAKAAHIEPTNPQHAIFAGNVCTQMDRPDDAAGWFTRATETDPQEPWGWAGLAESHRQNGDFDAALESIRTARRNAPTSIGFRVSEARILRESSRGRDAAMLLFALQPVDRATPAVTRELSAACTQIGEHGRAAEAWEALHLTQPGVPEAPLQAAAAWIRAGELERAATWLEAAEAAGATSAQLADVRALIRENAPNASTNQVR